MAKHKRRKARKNTMCKTVKVSACAVRLGTRRFKAKSCITDSTVKVCPSRKIGRKQTFKALKSNGDLVQLYRK